MIAPLLAVAGIFPGRFVELPVRDAKAVSICVIAPLPTLDKNQLGAARVLAKVLPDGTPDFTRRRVTSLTLGSGLPLQFVVMPDHFRIQFSVSPGDWSEGLNLAKSLIEDATVSSESVEQALDVLPLAKGGVWNTALSRTEAEYKSVHRREVVDFYHRAFRPERISVCVSGPFAPGQARDRWNSLYADYRPRFAPALLSGAPLQEATPNRSGFSLIDLQCPEIQASQPGFYSSFLATIALGAGKQSSVYRILREKMLLSYRQEAMLWPTPGGFETRILAVMKSREDEMAQAQLARQALLEDVASWDAATRDRALAMASSIYLRGLPLNPLQLQLTGSVQESQDDRTFMTAYWPLKTGSYWSETDFLNALKKVTLDEMKVAAAEALNSAHAR